MVQTADLARQQRRGPHHRPRADAAAPLTNPARRQEQFQRNPVPLPCASFAPRRRALLLAGAAAAVAPALAQPGRSNPGRPITVAQVVDTSAAQQDVSKDFLVGSRAVLAGHQCTRRPARRARLAPGRGSRRLGGQPASRVAHDPRQPGVHRAVRQRGRPGRRRRWPRRCGRKAWPSRMRRPGCRTRRSTWTSTRSPSSRGARSRSRTR